MKPRKKVRELKNADVLRISLVDKGANRIPFRVIKQHKSDGDTAMLDLTGIGFKKIFKKAAPAAPSVSAIVLPEKPANMERMVDVIQKAGFKTDKPVENTDGTFMFAQEDNIEEGSSIVSLSQDVAVVLKGFSPYSDQLADFNEVLGASGYWNGLSTACAALNQTICQKMQTASDPATATDEVKQVLADFGNYVAGLTSGLPQTAFKVEKAINDLAISMKAETTVAKKAEDDKAAKEAADKEAIAKAAKETTAPKGVDQADWDKMSDAEKAAWMKDNTKKEDAVKASPDVEAIAKAIKDSLGADIVRLSDSVNTLAKSQETLGTKVQEIATKSESLEKKLGGLVVGSAPNSKDAPVRTVKNDVLVGDGPFGGSFDTAFRRKA